MRSRFFSALVGAFLTCAALPASAQTVSYPAVDRNGPCYQPKPSKLAITKGSVACNSSTYYQRIGGYLNIDFQDLSLGELAGHMGYNITHTGRDLETMVPVASQPDLPAGASDAARFWHARQTEADPAQRVLVSRFFAPKIVNYSVTSGPFTPGWRKLVYLPVRPGSAAEKENKLAGAYILFNYFAADRRGNPYAAPGGDGHAISANNQVILVPTDLSPQIKGRYRDSVFFAVYSGHVPGDATNSYRLLNTLKAGFDVPPDGGATDYAIPDACAQCHGHDTEFGQAVDAKGAISTDPRAGVFPFVKPNYLDTDQWYDAMRLDYPDLIGVSEPVFDGGTDRGSASYRRAMDVIFALNARMQTQGAVALRPPQADGAPTDAFQKDAVEKWLALHRAPQDRVQVFAPVDRVFNDAALSGDRYRGELALTTDRLSQFCFRCHSSIKFNVFDYGTLKSQAGTYAGYIPDPMPLGRTMGAGDVACLKAGLAYVKTPGRTASQKVISACGSSTLMKGVSGMQAGYCYVLPRAPSGRSFADGAEIKQAACTGSGYAEKVWTHDAATGLIHSAARPDMCLGITPVYIDRAQRLISPTPIAGGVASYELQPIRLKRCAEAGRGAALMRWSTEAQGEKMVVFRSREDRTLCLSGTDDYSTGPLSDGYAEDCRSGFRNGAFVIRTFEPTKGAALE